MSRPASAVRTAPSDVQVERLGPDGAPLALNLWRLYTVTAAELGVTTGVLTGFTLHLENGRVGLIDAGKLMARERAELERIAWWNAQEDTASVKFIGGEWMRVTGSHLSAPFEQTYEPTFSDKPFGARLDELPKLTLIRGKPPQGVAEIGLVNFIEALEQQLNRADDFVDLSFLKTQANTHRIRQVLLGDEVADDLLISPILSSVVKRTSARVAEEDLVEALRRAPASATPSNETRAAGGASAAADTNFGGLSRFNVNVARKQSAVEKVQIKGATAASKITPTVEDVRQADPAIGKGFELRTLTIAKRFDAGPVLNAYDYADEGLREVLAEVRRQIAAAEARLRTIAGPLAEARHDVSVARALRQEERERVAAINARRDALIRDEVKFLAYVRPRAVDPTRRNVPGWKLESAGTLAPVPACLQRHDQPPDPLRAYVQLFRHAPARWFTDIAPRLRELDTREKLVELLAATQRSALVFSTEKRVPFATNITVVAEQSALLSAFSIVEASRTLAAGIQSERPDLRSWEDFRREVEQHSSLGDIIGGRHGNPAFARTAAAVLDQIESVATCLHAEFAAVPPAIRLAWVERYSQFDRPAPLNDLTALPRYGSLDRAARRRFQAFVDWIFQRVNTSEKDAFNLMNDLVRICLLLASHAPVRSLIAGHLPRPVPVRPGTLIPIRAFDPRLVRVGMEVHVWQAEKIVARARVEDLHDDGEVSARIERVQTATNVLDQTMRVQFIAPALGFAIQRAQP